MEQPIMRIPSDDTILAVQLLRESISDRDTYPVRLSRLAEALGSVAREVIPADDHDGLRNSQAWLYAALTDLAALSVHWMEDIHRRHGGTF